MSIIVPAYNRADVIGEAIDSILAQTYENFEAIIIDDGSQDNTRDVVATYRDPRITYVYKPNGGLSSARNAGFELARGEFIAFLDSDDAWLPWKLRTQLEIFQRQPDVGMIWSDMSTFVEDGKILEHRYLTKYYSVYDRVDITKTCRRVGTLDDLGTGVPTESAQCAYYVGDIFREMFLGNLVHPPTAIVRRERLRKSGPFQPEITGPGCEDYHFYFRVSEHGPVAFMDAPTILYRLHAGQISTAHSINDARADLNLINHWSPRWPASLPKSLLRDRLARAHAWLGTEELSLGHTRIASSHLWESLRLRPNQPRTVARLAACVIPPRAFPFLRTVKRHAPRPRMMRTRGMQAVIATLSACSPMFGA